MPAWRCARDDFVSVWYATSRTTSLRNRHHRSSTVEHAEVDELVHVSNIERLAHFCAEALQPAECAGRSEHGRVVDHLALAGGEGVEACGDQGAE